MISGRVQCFLLDKKGFYMKAILSGWILSCSLVFSMCGMASSGGSTDLGEQLKPSPGQIVGSGIALKGNGPRVFAHFGGLAKSLEVLNGDPLITSVGGGSSAAITAFLYENMLRNPAVLACDSSECQAQRLSLLLKSMEGVVDAMISSNVYRALQKLRGGIGGFSSSLNSFSEGQIIEVIELLESLRLGCQKWVNPDFVKFLTRLDTPVLFKIRQVKRILDHLGTFDEEENADFFFMPGLVNMNQFAESTGRLAAFFNPRSSTHKQWWIDFFEQYSPEQSALGKRWRVLDQETRDVFDRQLKYFMEFVHETRLDEPVDSYDFGTVIGTAFIESKDAVKEYQRFQRKFIAGNSIDKGFLNRFEKDLKIGLMGSERTLSILEKVQSELDSEDWKRMVMIHKTSWRDVMTTSPAEPGLSDGVYLKHGLSLGGWVAPYLVQALRSSTQGQPVVYLGRPGAAMFGHFVAQTLGLNHLALKDLFSEEGEDNSYKRNVGGADYRMIVDWDAPPAASLEDCYAHFEVGYQGDLLANPDFTS